MDLANGYARLDEPQTIALCGGSWDGQSVPDPNDQFVSIPTRKFFQGRMQTTKEVYVYLKGNFYWLGTFNEAGDFFHKEQGTEVLPGRVFPLVSEA